MEEIFKAITNIAVNLEKNIFVGYTNFAMSTLTNKQIEKNIYTYCSTIIENEFTNISSIKSIIGKDTKEYVQINKLGKYIISYVSIDNIGLLDLNFSLGSIFSIYENNLEADSLQAVVYITYGPTFQLVFATKKDSVKYFSYKDNMFVEQDILALEEKGKINSTAGKVNEFDDKHKYLIQNLFDEGYRLRFSDSLALDTHQILFKKGGIYSSPATTSNPKGTLNIIFEAYPISFIIELANGMAIDGSNRILDIKSPSLEQNTPIYFGSKYEISKV